VNEPTEDFERKRIELAEMLGNRVRKRAKHLRKWARREHVSCYRVYDRDIPELPLIVELYDDCLHVSLYERDEDERDDAPGRTATFLMESLESALDIPQERIFLKRRRRQEGDSQYEKNTTSDRRVVSEGGLRLVVDLAAYLDTGLFLDHRATRRWVREHSSGLHVLNLYAYTGSFSVYAADGDPRTVTSVDLSTTYLDWAAENLRQNDYEPTWMRLGSFQTRSEPARGQHRLVRADTHKFLESAAAAKQRYELVILDPPTFSNSRSMETSFDVQRDHVELLHATRRVLAKDGTLLFSTNRRRFKLDEDAIGAKSLEETTNRFLSEDFKARPAHRSWLLQF